MKRYWVYITLLALLLAGSLYVSLNSPRPIDWRDTYSRRDKIPYGTYILYELMPQIFPGKSIEPSSSPIYEFLNEEDDLNKNLVFINSAFSPDKYETSLLLQYASRGGNVFISTESLEGTLADSLKIHTVRNFYFPTQAIDTELRETAPLWLEEDSNRIYYVHPCYCLFKYRQRV
jgi:hypothetical protein